MGFGKWLAGGICTAGAIIAAPIVLPAAGIAAASAAAAGAAAYGTVAATATAVGAAVAATSVGTAVVSGAAAVGTATAAVAGAVGITGATAIVGTTAGAAALGVVTTAGVTGAGTAIAGANKLNKAKEIKNEAQNYIEDAQENIEVIRKKTNQNLESLGQVKISIWSSFSRFTDIYGTIKNKPKIYGGPASDQIGDFGLYEIEELNAISLTVKDIVAGSSGAVASGTLIGLATSGGIITTITTASTGTAISTLSGAAATNATLAALGGGSLATGGAGMAGGTMMLGGLAVAPILAVGGLMLNSKGNKNLQAANNMLDEAYKYNEKCKEEEEELKKIQRLSSQVTNMLKDLYKKYLAYIESMGKVVRLKQDYNLFTLAEKKDLERLILLVKLLKELCAQNIFDQNHQLLANEVTASVHKCSASLNEF